MTLILLPSRVTAIYLQIRTSHERTRVTDQEDRRTPVFPWLRQPSQHILRWPLCLPLRKLDKQLLHHRRHDVSRRDGVDTNIMLAPFRSKVASQLNNACFRCVVCRANQALQMSVDAISISLWFEKTYPIRDTPTHTRNHHNTPPISKPYHLLRHRLRTHEHTRDIHLKHAIRILGSVVQRRGFLLDSSCGDQAIEASLGVGNLLHNRVEGGHVAHVDLAVCEGGVELGFGARGDGVEVRTGFGEAIEGVDYYIIETVSQICSCGIRNDGVCRLASGFGYVPFAPASRRASACVRPRPRAAPETSTTLFARLNSNRPVVAILEIMGF